MPFLGVEKADIDQMLSPAEESQGAFLHLYTHLRLHLGSLVMNLSSPSGKVCAEWRGIMGKR